ncbi:MAG: hypothetical protein EXX96DRAFT_612326 [Benjaminiella poitrasii]|nr:MAG: hypothetical protein EXX96DRAFT_612326 [Benjaminiella poitrasii]
MRFNWHHNSDTFLNFMHFNRYDGCDEILVLFSLFKYYLITDELEHDPVRKVWSFVANDHAISLLLKRTKISSSHKVERRANADTPDIFIYYGRYELGMTKVGKEELDSIKALNDSVRMNNTVKSMHLNLSKGCSSTEIAIERMIISGLKINFFGMVNPKASILYILYLSKFNSLKVVVLLLLADTGNMAQFEHQYDPQGLKFQILFMIKMMQINFKLQTSSF